MGRRATLDLLVHLEQRDSKDPRVWMGDLDKSAKKDILENLDHEE